MKLFNENEKLTKEKAVEILTKFLLEQYGGVSYCKDCRTLHYAVVRAAYKEPNGVLFMVNGTPAKGMLVGRFIMGDGWHYYIFQGRTLRLRHFDRWNHKELVKQLDKLIYTILHEDKALTESEERFCFRKFAPPAPPVSEEEMRKYWEAMDQLAKEGKVEVPEDYWQIRKNLPIKKEPKEEVDKNVRK